MKLRRIFYDCLLAPIALVTVAACSSGGQATTGPATQPVVSSPTALPAGYPVETQAQPVPSNQEPSAAYPAPETTELPSGYPYPAPAEVAPQPASGEAASAALIDLAKQDLAQRLSMTADQISVVSSASSDWPDTSLGCPQPGMAYAQVITPGYRIVLEQAQKQYEYHTNLADQVVLCTP